MLEESDSISSFYNFFFFNSGNQISAGSLLNCVPNDKVSLCSHPE